MTAAHGNKIKVPNLIKCAITHYQFETIHPFLDGNGRIGRLLIPFYLLDKGDLHNPSLYISDYFEKNRNEYYAALSNARTENDLMGWINFFLDAVRETSEKGCETFGRIFALRNEVIAYCESKGKRGATLQRMFRILYSNPRLTVNRLAELAECDYSMASRAIKELLRDGWLVAGNEDARNRIFDFARYLALFVR